MKAAMAATIHVPCPVRLGKVKAGGPNAELHMYTTEKNLNKMEKLLKNGVDVDCANNLGQTPLFCACLLGLTNAVELLLRYGADPNHRCMDLSTPVHAAVFSCNPWLVSEVLDAGGDLRLHDAEGRKPQDWAEAGAQEHSTRMQAFLKACAHHMQSLLQTLLPGEKHSTLTSCKYLLPSLTLKELLRPGGADLLLNKKVTIKDPVNEVVQCYGFGKLCLKKHGELPGLLAWLTLISETELSQPEDEPLVTFYCGDFSKMSNYSWKGNRVTVTDLWSRKSRQRGREEIYKDLVVKELEYCSYLFHPHLMQLLAVCMDSELNLRLVFERVYIGTLHSLLHHKYDEFPVLSEEKVMCVLLQVCEALMFLHGHELVLRSLSSHTVLMVQPALAKITCLGFMVPIERTGPVSTPLLPLPPVLYNWAAPEVVRRRGCTEKADLYSFCALIQEFYTNAEPWGKESPLSIRQVIDSGWALTADPSVPPPYYQMLQTGLLPRAQNRVGTLHQLRYTLRCDLRDMAERQLGRRASLNNSPETRSHNHLDKNRQASQEELDDSLESETEDLQIKYAERWWAGDQEGRRITTDTKGCRETLGRGRIKVKTRQSTGGQKREVQWAVPELEMPEDEPEDIIHCIILNQTLCRKLLQECEQILDKLQLQTWIDSQPYTYDDVDEQVQANAILPQAAGPPQIELQDWFVPATRILCPAKCPSTSESCLSIYTSAMDNSLFHQDIQQAGGEEPTRDQYMPGLQPSATMASAKEHPLQARPSELHIKPQWAREATDLVALMTQGPPGASAGRSENSELVNVHQDCLACSTDKQHYTKLEHNCRSFLSDPDDDSEEDYKTFSRTLERTHRMPVGTEESKDGSSAANYSKCLVEQCSKFLTPRPDTESFCPEANLHVTMEVCQSSSETKAQGNQMLQEAVRERNLPPLISKPDLVEELSDISSIIGSPLQKTSCSIQKPSVSTPFIPHSPSRRCFFQESGIPSLQSQLETTPWCSLSPFPQSTVTSSDITVGLNPSVFNPLQNSDQHRDEFEFYTANSADEKQIVLAGEVDPNKHVSDHNNLSSYEEEATRSDRPSDEDYISATDSPKNTPGLESEQLDSATSHYTDPAITINETKQVLNLMSTPEVGPPNCSQPACINKSKIDL
ncbi:uncharacterized protein tex14 isoform X3 [Denticeps clupeoides]|uniref:uncharacterized protein tex14 isoform X3 n=1 Tax=Denticeps clupeoides TaxID=299321 RepID=UPI0010A2FB48|nr:inactive serine/threonine-protein kinase TEX14 isoform X3 [Denticeps clupeoides]